MDRHGHGAWGCPQGVQRGSLKFAFLALFGFHAVLMPLFPPALSGVRTGHLSVSDGPQWNQMIQTGKLEQPDGAILIFKRRFQ